MNTLSLRNNLSFNVFMLQQLLAYKNEAGRYRAYSGPDVRQNLYYLAYHIKIIVKNLDKIEDERRDK